MKIWFLKLRCWLLGHKWVAQSPKGKTAQEIIKDIKENKLVYCSRCNANEP